MINKIGIENFRVFKDCTEFEMKPLTILTGPNNSGKSSFIKFLLLLKEGVEKLNFEQGKLHNLESFERVLNWKNDSDELEFSFNFRNQFKAKFTYKIGKLIYINLYKNESLLFEYYEQEDSSTDNIFQMDGFHSIKKFNINYLIDKIYSIDIDTISYVDLTTILYGWDLKNMYGSKDLFKLSNKELRDIFTQLNRDRLLYKIYMYGDDVTEKYKNELLEVQKKFFDHIKTDDFRFHGTGFRYLSKIDKLKRIIEDIKDIYHFKYFLKNEKLFDFGEEDIEIKYSAIGEFIFKQKIHTGNIVDGEEEFVNLFDVSFSYPISGMKLDLKDLHYISANRGSQKRILSNKSENDIDEIILEFTKSKNIREDFINKAFQILGIDGKLNIERHENVISVVKIKLDDKEISLADLGYGFSQVIPVILKIHNIYSNYNDDVFSMGDFENTLILEEPEANLHPNLQSKLANILVLANKEFGIHFIIETHSEYLIRKLQYLTAKKEIKTDDTIIYYFNSDKYVTSTEKKIKEIRINSTGGLTDTFGHGFFDESTRLQFELLKINQDQIN